MTVTTPKGTIMRNMLLATACALALVGCSTGGQAPLAELTPDTLIAEASARAEGALAPQDGYEALFAALPGGAAGQASGFSPEGDGAVATGVVIAFGDSGVSLTIDEMRAYDLTPDALAAAEGSQLAARLDLRGVSFEGLGGATEAMTDGLMGGMLGDAMDGARIDQAFDRYDYRMEQLVLDGFTVAALPEANEGTEDDLAKDYLRVMSLFGADRFLATGVTADLDVSQTVGVTVELSGDEAGDAAGETVATDTSMTLRMDEFGGADWRGLDLGMEFLRGLSTETRQTTNGIATPASDVRAEEIVIRDLSLSRVLPFLLSETMPSAADTDLMSLGRWEMTNVATLLGGRTISTTEAATLDLTAWHGLMPERITYEATERVEVGGLVEMVREQVDAVAAATAANPDAEAEALAEAPDMAMFEEVATALREAGLETVRSNGRLDYAYAPETGAVTFRTNSVTDEMGTIALDLAMMLPSYARFAETPVEGGVEGAGEETSPLSALLAEEAALDRLSLTLDDEGGLDALLQVIIAVADATADTDEAPGLAMLRGQEPAQLRQMLSGLVTMGSVQAAQAIPQVSDYATALSAWLSEGGELTVVIDPDSPLGAAAIAEMQTMPGGPAAMVDRLGITVTHVGE